MRLDIVREGECLEEYIRGGILHSVCDNYRVFGALQKLEHETILQDRASDR